MTTHFAIQDNDTSESITQNIFRALALPAAICVMGVALLWSLPASAQSFSCAEAEKPAEFAICNSEELLTMDEQLGTVFSAAYVKAETVPQRQQVVREHEQWMQKRNSCGNDITCINLRYQERISKLNQKSL